MDLKHCKMIVVWGACLLLASVGIFLMWPQCVVERTSGALRQDVYVWQRSWNEHVVKAVKDTGEFDVCCVLAAEVSWDGSRPKVVRVQVDYAALKAGGKRVGIGLRIGPYDGGLQDYEKSADFVSGLARSLVDEALAAGVKPFELQIDFDCAESKLDGYRRWVDSVVQRVADVDVVITVLPCWLPHKEFADLAAGAAGYVLQVHSLERPESYDSEMVLCEVTNARKWVEIAAEIGVGFRVALPTYGYMAAFDREGRFLGLSAEGFSASWPGEVGLRRVSSNPAEIAKLVAGWREDRPVNMEGLIWYRLPVEGDRLNWKAVTLAAVMRGQKPIERVTVEVEFPEPQLAELLLVNSGEADSLADVVIEVSFDGAKVIASDGLRGFVFEDWEDGLRLEYRGRRVTDVLRAGESWNIGWIRFDSKAEVKADVVTSVAEH